MLQYTIIYICGMKIKKLTFFKIVPNK